MFYYFVMFLFCKLPQEGRFLERGTKKSLNTINNSVQTVCHLHGPGLGTLLSEPC